MSLHAYIDNEVPAFGEWTSETHESQDSKMIQGGAYAFPERGSVGLRCSCLDTEVAAYCTKTAACPTPAANENVALGFWYRLGTKPLDISIILDMKGTFPFLHFCIDADGAVFPYVETDTPPFYYFFTTAFTATVGRWHYLQMILHRAAGAGAATGWAQFYADGELIDTYTSYQNFTKMGGTTYGLYMGCTYLASFSTYVADYDEIKVGDAMADIEPYVPTPADENPSAARTVVLFRKEDTDSHVVVDAAIAAGVPRGNCLGLNCSTDEDLADYATFQDEVEASITNFLTNNPTIAGNCTCFLLGRNVPGSFTAGGSEANHSATSRLMNFGTAFSSDTANPLYNPATVARLTKTLLAGKYLASRCDGADAVALISRAATISALASLADADTLWSDESAYLPSLPCQRLRISTHAITGASFTNDAFVFGDTDPAFGTAGSRVAFADDTADSASGIRTRTAAC